MGQYEKEDLGIYQHRVAEIVEFYSDHRSISAKPLLKPRGTGQPSHLGKGLRKGAHPRPRVGDSDSKPLVSHKHLTFKPPSCYPTALMSNFSQSMILRGHLPLSSVSNYLTPDIVNAHC